jgi:hypothetical protein
LVRDIHKKEHKYSLKILMKGTHILARNILTRNANIGKEYSYKEHKYWNELLTHGT